MITKAHRLLRAHNLEELFKKGKRASSPLFVVYTRENGLFISRFAIVVSLKISKKAVERNRIKRRMRAFIHTTLPSVKKGYDVLIRVQSSSVVRLTYKEIEKELAELLNKAHISSI